MTSHSSQHGAHLGPVGPRWAPCWSHKPCYQGRYMNTSIQSNYWWCIQQYVWLSFVNNFAPIMQWDSVNTASLLSVEIIMTSSIGNIFWVTGPLFGESTGDRSESQNLILTCTLHDIFDALKINATNHLRGIWHKNDERLLLVKSSKVVKVLKQKQGNQTRARDY